MRDKDEREANELRERQASGQSAEARKAPVRENLLAAQAEFESQLEQYGGLLNVAARNDAYTQMRAVRLNDAAGQFLRATDDLMDCWAAASGSSSPG